MKKISVAKQTKCPWRRATGWFFAGILAVLMSIPAFGQKEGFRVVDEHPKIAPRFQQEIEFLARRPEYDTPIPVIVRVEQGLFARDRLERESRSADRRNMLPLIHSYTAQLTASQVQQLLASPLVTQVSPDARLRPEGQRRLYLFERLQHGHGLCNRCRAENAGGER